MDRGQDAHLRWPADRRVRRPTRLDDLEVHPALAAGSDDGLGGLPAYVRREFDERLDAMVAAASDGPSGIAMLVGDSSTGTARACWEAMKNLPDGWRLWHPMEPNRALL
ncbi:hypothetical protein [Kribbella solani]|uniref:Uncharacterized protein n=1 Tax=Kribbella solani TaxID=236067 RepID=A0A841DSM0_9ACTN|nr:hypothetical protein [Kribbella solani]MBB5980911.1 hypothetical protein [Kribbella solani]